MVPQVSSWLHCDTVPVCTMLQKDGTSDINCTPVQIALPEAHDWQSSDQK